jgi:c-di-GMP-binding flagellar brake protein YcgR
MQNRRQFYRHSFAHPAHHPVRLRLLGHDEPLAGTMLNLSLGGLALRIEGETELEPGTGMAEISLGPDQPPLTMPVELLHRDAHDPAIYGFRFLPRVDARAEEECERRVWSFLLREQRLQRRKR